MRLNQVLKAASLGVAVTAFVAGNAISQQGNAFGLGQPAAVGELPNSSFRDALLALEPQARGRAMKTLRGGEFTTGDIPFLRVDRRGGVFFEDPEWIVEDGGEVSPPSEISEVAAFALHSKPGAPKTVYIDFDGHDVRGTVWNANTGFTSHPLKAYDADGLSTWSPGELDVVADVWRRMAEDFAPYNTDVTTEEPPFTVDGSGRINYGANVGHIVVTRKADENGNEIYSCGCGGVAYYGGFGNSYYSPGLVFIDGVGTGAHNIAEAASHELGHNLYLAHDGTSTSGYYTGHGSGNVGWAPIMGVGYYQEVTQWSKGEYSGANNSEDDLSKITSYMPFRSDDHEDTLLGSATPLLITGSTNVVGLARVSDPSAADLANKGVIEDRTDIDLFYMDIGAGSVNLTVTPGYLEVFASSSNRGMNLDIRARLLDEFGTVVATSNPDLDTYAQINYSAGVAGRYYLEIEGVGRGAVLSDGYSDYASIGQYYINGTVPEDVVVTDPPTAPSDLSASLVGDANIDLTWTDPATAAEADEAGYRVYRSVNGGGFSLHANLAKDSNSYSDNNLGNGEYAYYVEVYNGAGTAQSAATTPIVIDTPTVAVATSESTSSGTIASGSYLSTQVASGSETLREQHNGGKPRNRRSFVDHTWNVTGVAPGATVNLSVTASAPGNSEDEDFIFSYSVNGGGWTSLGMVQNGTGAQTMTAMLNPATSGSVRIRVVDSDPGTTGASVLDTVTISQISITSTGDAGDQPPMVAITSPADGTTVMTGDPITLIGTAEDDVDGDISGSITWSSSLDGSLGTSASVNVTLTEGVHTVTATATDTALQDGSDAITVTISNTPLATTMAVSDLDGSGALAGRGGKWQASVSITVRDNLGQPVSGAAVGGTWGGGASGSGSCTTNGSGVCSVSKGGLKNNAGSVTYTVNNISGALTYVSGDNSDTEGDSNGTTITVTKP